ncbi:MAG: transglutaminase family protein [Actinomycetota bacterium]
MTPGAVTGSGPQLRAGAPEATLALAGLTTAVALGMGRLFEGGDHLVPLVGAAVVGHALMWAGRRRGVPLGVAAAAALAGVALTAGWLLFPETTTAGVPGPGTLAAARSALAGAWTQFGDVVAPAPASDGFLLAAMVGVGVTAVLADWAAFRMRVLFEAVVPSFTLFAFTATLGTAGGRAPMVALYLAALLLFIVVHRAGLEAEGTSWFASRSRGGTRALLRGAAVLGAAAVASAVVVGPHLPGADAEAVLAWRDTGSDGDGRRSTVSPLVDIRGRLVDQSTTEVFTVRTNRPAYWRLTSLDTFNGQIWSSDASYRPVGSRLPAAGGGAPADRVVQEFRIGALSSIWLPAAYRPEAVGGVDDVSYNADLGSLITGEDTTDGLTYTVESAVPRLTAEELRGASAVGGLSDRRRFVDLPPVPGRVAALAESLAAGGDGTPFGTGLAIQSFFRQRFVYDLNASAGHSDQALERFLFTDRRGYCEQFAGAFAVLARHVGLPTRVAVGFTPGEPGEDGLLHVRGLNAHAWPEVFIDGFGWVAFEPTPGRGAPGSDAYLGVPPAQASPDSPNTATTAAPPTTVADEEVPTPSTSVAPGEVAAGAGAEAGAGRPLTRHPLVVAVVVLVALALAVPVAKGARRRRRRAGAATPADRVWVAWTEAEDAVGRAGAPRRPSETLAEHARRAGPAAALDDEAALALATLAADAAAASYAAGPLADEVASRAVLAASAVERDVTGRASARRRVLWTLDPRPLLPRR